MGVAKQLFQLQEIDLEIDAAEQARDRISGQLGESGAIDRAQEQVRREKQRLEELRRRQHDLEWQLDDISAKMAEVEEKLFSGRVQSPKELTALQQELDIFKAKRDKVEETALGTMDEVESGEADIAGRLTELEAMRGEWQRQQQQLSGELEKVQGALADLGRRRQLLADEVPPQAAALYESLRQGKNLAVARVEQGICRGCRISLPMSELQRVKGSDLVRCGSCGRILFLA